MYKAEGVPADEVEDLVSQLGASKAVEFAERTPERKLSADEARVSALDDARQAGLLAKHRPTLAYHRQEPYWASSPAIMTDCAVEGRYATILQTRGGELIAQAGPIARAPATRPRVPERNDLRRRHPAEACEHRPPQRPRRHLRRGRCSHAGAARLHGRRLRPLRPGVGRPRVAAVLALLPVQRQEPGRHRPARGRLGDGAGRDRRRPSHRRDVRAAQRRREARRLGRRPHGGANGRGIAAGLRRPRLARVVLRSGRVPHQPLPDARPCAGQRPPGAPARRRTDGRRRLAGMARPLGAHGPQRHVESSRAAAAREAVEAPGRVPRRRPRTAAQAGTDLRRSPRGRAVPSDHRAARWRRRPHQLRRACRGGAAGAAAALGRVHGPPRGALHALVRRGGETGDRPSPGAHRRG